MATPYAEVIGDPIAHSKSPLIHGFWLQKLGLKGEYRSARISPRELPAYFDSRRRDVWWRGCNVTAPLKTHAATLVGAPSAVCGFVGAVNCVTRTPLHCLVGTNTDVAGVAEALAGVEVAGRHVLLIGAGGAARGALCYLLRERVGSINIAVRDPAKAGPLKRLGEAIHVDSFADIAESAPSLVINATPLGMTGGAEMPDPLLDVAERAEAVFDMVYAPADTPLLARARGAGAKAVDGFAMLIGQAAPSFELFFGAAAPREHDAELRGLLAS